MKRKTLLILSCLIISIGLTGCVENNDLNQSENNTKNKQEEVNIEKIYENDEAINLFINQYNKINNSKITSDMLSKKHIGGRDRDNVVSVKNDKLEINIYDNFGSNGKYNMSVYVGYTGINSTLNNYKEQFINYIKLFDNTLTDDEINNHWDILLSDYHSSYEINDIDLTVSTNTGTISYFKLTKTLEF